MLTGTALMNELVDELNELKLSTMAATLDDLYHRPGFLEMDRLTLIAELIGPQFQEKSQYDTEESADSSSSERISGGIGGLCGL